MSTYLGYPVFDIEPDAGAPPLALREHPADTLSGAGGQYVDAARFRPEAGFDFSFVSVSREEAAALADFFDSRRGRLLPFWVPGPGADLVPAEGFSAGDTVLSVCPNRYFERWLTEESAGRHVAILVSGAGPVCRAVVSAGPEEITLDAPVGVDAPEPFAVRISFLWFARFSSDALEAPHYTPWASEAVLSFTWLRAETPAFPTTVTTTTSTTSTTST